MLTHTEHFIAVGYQFHILILLLSGLDPADNNRLLIRKIVQLKEGSYAYEETTISKNKHNGAPSVHTTMSKLGGFNLEEHLTNSEIQFRGAYRPMPNVVGFSLYHRKTQAGGNHLSIVENTIEKSSGYSWT